LLLAAQRAATTALDAGTKKEKSPGGFACLAHELAVHKISERGAYMTLAYL
jgi:hypothetical protein